MAIELKNEFSLSTLFSRSREIILSATSEVRTHSTTITTLGLRAVNEMAMGLGRTAFAFTGGRIHLNHVVPLSIRRCLRQTLGLQGVVPASGAVRDLIVWLLRTDDDFTYLVIAAPLVEEFTFRFPLWVISQRGDQFLPEIMTTRLLENVVDLTGSNLVNGSLVVMSSIAFTYIHSARPQPGRAAALFVLGLAFAYLALVSDGGMRYAISAHIIHNFVCYLTGP